MSEGQPLKDRSNSDNGSPGLGKRSRSAFWQLTDQTQRMERTAVIHEENEHRENPERRETHSSRSPTYQSPQNFMQRSRPRSPPFKRHKSSTPYLNEEPSTSSSPALYLGLRPPGLTGLDCRERSPRRKGESWAPMHCSRVTEHTPPDAHRVLGIQEFPHLLQQNPDSQRHHLHEHSLPQPSRAPQSPAAQRPAVGSGATCFRISGIPSGWDRDTLELKLSVIDPDLDMTTAELSEQFPDCYEPTLCQVALLNVDQCTPYLKTIRQGERRMEVIRENDRGANAQKILIYIDKDFYDLTPLNEPETPIVADLIAVTGLGGHAFGSWRSRADTQAIDRPMWLRDFLPIRFPNIRIMTYGYDSSLGNRNGTNLTDYRRNFKDCLKNSRRNCQERPIIFIGHSLGGILVIQTLIESRQNPQYRDIFDCIRGLFLFGTPHQGLKTDDLLMMVENDNLEAKSLLAQLNEGSEFLENQKEALSHLWNEFRGKVVTFYETQKTKQVKKKTEQGIFKREGEAVQMVLRMSAQLHLPGENCSSISLNHTDMVKFDSPHNRAFQTVMTHLSECVGA